MAIVSSFFNKYLNEPTIFYWTTSTVSFVFIYIIVFGRSHFSTGENRIKIFKLDFSSFFSWFIGFTKTCVTFMLLLLLFVLYLNEGKIYSFPHPIVYWVIPLLQIAPTNILMKMVFLYFTISAYASQCNGFILILEL